MGCNRKVKLLVYELFRGWDEGSKGHFRFRPNFTKCNVAAKPIYLSKTLSDFGGIISVTNAENRAKNLLVPVVRNGEWRNQDEHKLNRGVQLTTLL